MCVTPCVSEVASPPVRIYRKSKRRLVGITVPPLTRASRLVVGYLDYVAILAFPAAYAVSLSVCFDWYSSEHWA